MNNTRTITKEYRLAHWAGIMREREGSGLSIKAYCEGAGFPENQYFYWQRKLREAACEELTPQGKATNLTPVFAEVKLAAQPMFNTSAAIPQSHVCIEAGGARLIAGSEYPVSKLAELLRVVSRECC